MIDLEQTAGTAEDQCASARMIRAALLLTVVVAALVGGLIRRKNASCSILNLSGYRPTSWQQDRWMHQSAYLLLPIYIYLPFAYDYLLTCLPGIHAYKGALSWPHCESRRRLLQTLPYLGIAVVGSMAM